VIVWRFSFLVLSRATAHRCRGAKPLQRRVHLGGQFGAEICSKKIQSPLERLRHYCSTECSTECCTASIQLQ